MYSGCSLSLAGPGMMYDIPSHPPPRVRFARRVVESVSRPLSDSEFYLIRRYLEHAEICSLCRRDLRMTCSRTTRFLHQLDRHLYAGRDGLIYSRRASDLRNTRVEIPRAFRVIREMLSDGLLLEENVARYVERQSVRLSSLTALISVTNYIEDRSRQRPPRQPD